MAEEADVVVVGAGVMGLASAWALARAGREPLVLEQFEVGHPHGSSHGATRIFRLAYDQTEWVRFAQQAFVLWRELEAESGMQLLELNGLLDLSEDPDLLTATLDATGTAYEVLTPEKAHRRFGLATTCCKVVWQPDAGVARADRAVAAFAAGRAIREQTRVRAIVPEGDRVRVETDGGAIDASAVVVAAGAWAKPLLADIGIDLPVVPTRETVSYFRLAEERIVPSVIDYPNRETYSLTAGRGVLKVGVHRSGPPTDPERPGVADEEIVRFASDWAARSYELAQPEPANVETCIYTNTDDARFIIERHGPVVVCAACTGHGFKFAPAVGTRVAGLVAG